MKKILFFVFLVFLSFGAAGQELAGRVVGISDGDTITVLLQNKQSLKVRLYGIDCPEKRQAYGARAKQCTSALAFQKYVSLKVMDTDQYGRSVAIVILPDERILNHEIVRAGLAWWYRKYAPKDQALRDLEASARVNQIGLWADPQPIPPWEFRKQK